VVRWAERAVLAPVDLHGASGEEHSEVFDRARSSIVPVARSVVAFGAGSRIDEVSRIRQFGALGHFVEVPVVWHAFEFVDAVVSELDAGSRDEINDGTGDKDRAGCTASTRLAISEEAGRA
jgi:hypothetical protein